MALLHPRTVDRVQRALHGQKLDRQRVAGPPHDRNQLVRPPDKNQLATGHVPEKGPGGSTVAPVKHPGAPVTPFLTPAQQLALLNWETTYKFNAGALSRKEGDATYNTNQGLFNVQHTHDINTNAANQSMAARGLFQSSIRDSDLNDLDATLTLRQNVLNTNLQRLLLDTNSRLDKMQTDWTNTHNFYNTLAVANAQNQPPVLNGPNTPGQQPKGPGPGKPIVDKQVVAPGGQGVPLDHNQLGNGADQQNPTVDRNTIAGFKPPQGPKY